MISSAKYLEEAMFVMMEEQTILKLVINNNYIIVYI